MIPTNNQFGDVIYERHEPEFDKAWETLIGRGYDPVQWMYMNSRLTHNGCPRSHYFKNISTRKYVVVDEIGGTP